MKTKNRNKSIGGARFVVLAFLICLPVQNLSAKSSVSLAQKSAQKQSAQVVLLTNSVELLDVTPLAEKCRNPKDATTIRLRVTSTTPVDVRLYAQIGYKKWLNKDFANRKSGTEITDYMCRPKAQYKVYARASGSAEAWPKP